MHLIGRLPPSKAKQQGNIVSENYKVIHNMDFLSAARCVGSPHFRSFHAKWCMVPSAFYDMRCYVKVHECVYVADDRAKHLKDLSLFLRQNYF